MVDSDLKVSRPLTSLKQMVVDKLRTAVTDGRLPPGSRLIERKLCEMLDVSRPLVREALSQLEVEGLIQIIPHRGPFVAIYTDAETISIYEVRIVLEELAGQLFVKNANDAERRELYQALDTIKVEYANPDVSDLIATKSKFYIALADGTHSPILVEMLRQIHSRVTWLRRETLARKGRLKKAVKEMGEIVRQIKKGDAQAAGKACRTHVESALAQAIEILSEQQITQETNGFDVKSDQVNNH